MLTRKQRFALRTPGLPATLLFCAILAVAGPSDSPAHADAVIDMPPPPPENAANEAPPAQSQAAPAASDQQPADSTTADDAAPAELSPGELALARYARARIGTRNEYSSQGLYYGAPYRHPNFVITYSPWHWGGWGWWGPVWGGRNVWFSGPFHSCW